MARIYVSSTFNDLQECRRQVSLVIRRMGHEDVAMEYYVAEDKRPVAKCLDDVANCDLYIGIFAWRYGWIPRTKNPKKRSITELEYRQAFRKKKTCLIFLLDDKAPWPPAFVDDNKKRMKKLRDELSEKHGAALFTSADNIGSVVAPAMYEWMRKARLFVISEPITELHINEYYTSLRQRYDVLALEGLTPPHKEEYLQIQLRSIFVEQSVRENPPPVELPKDVWEKLSRDKEIHPDDLPFGITLDDIRRARETYYEKPSRPVLDVLTDTHHQHVIILGDPGSGKSTLARYLVLSIIDPVVDEKLRAFDGYLPLLIELRSYVALYTEGNYTTFLDFIEFLGKAEGEHLTKAALHNYLKNDGRAVVIFDGLDEILEPGKREQITRQIVGFCNDYSNARVIVTSRVIGYRRKILTDAGFTHFTLQDLDTKQVENFVARWYNLAMRDRPDEAKERREHILRAYRESASIRQLAGNPMLLTVMAILGKHQELPRERWELYDHAARVLIQYWDANKYLRQLRVDADLIGEEDKQELLQRLAFRIQGGGTGLTGSYIHRDQLQAEFEGYLEERYSQTKERAVMISRAMTEQLRERNFILSLYGANIYGFVHRAFLEYFCALAIVHKFEKTRELTIEQLKNDIYGAHGQDENWREILRLICGMIDGKWVGEILLHLVNSVNRPWRLSSRRFTLWNVPLALQCLTEVHNLHMIENAATQILQTLCDFFDAAMELQSEHFDELIETEVNPALITIDQTFPNIGVLVNWVARRPRHASSLRQVRGFGLLVGKIGKSSEQIHSEIFRYVQGDWNLRILVPGVLAEGWNYDPQTLPLLCNLAVSDKHPAVRRAALDAVARTFNENMQVMSLLEERAVNDVNEVVRYFAVEALAREFRNQARPLLLINDWAQHSSDASVRRAAVVALAEQFREDPGTLPSVRDRAENDPDEIVRGAAVQALAHEFRGVLTILPMVRAWATNASDRPVRHAAIEALAREFPDDPQTLRLLREWAMNSKDASVRRTAIEALSHGFSHDPQTLPFLRDRAVQDTLDSVRSTAVEAIEQEFRESSQVLAVWHDLANNAYDPRVRAAAVGALNREFRENPEALAVWRDLAINANDPNVRISAVDALAREYRYDVQTVPLLRDRAICDVNEVVRRSAVNALVREFRDEPQTLTLLQDRAQNDENELVRAASIEALAHGFREDSRNLQILRERVQFDASDFVRRTSIGVLAREFRHDEHILMFLREWATRSEDQSIRCAALGALGQQFRDDPATLLLIQDRAISDPSPQADDEQLPAENYVREVAINLIVEYWPTHPDTVPFLHERGRNDPTLWLRKRAQELAVYFSGRREKPTNDES